ncbi:MAG: OprO/OprP family phosphate-selective porin [Acidobacteria bacterium]|nr:OprO/OprP family phosphate-selective porin [Acidobacteriota bacterium]
MQGSARAIRRFALLAAFVSLPAFAQDDDAAVERLKNELEKLKISGYLQSEYLTRDEGVDEFRVRRGRLKFTYRANDYASFVIQPDFSSAGVSVKDAYLEVTEDWTGWDNTLTAGQFKWPFGFEVLQSSSNREVPERARVIRELFPGERDRGMMFSGEIPGGRYDYRIGVFNGNGTSDSEEVDSAKDIVGRFGVGFGAVRGGVSGYQGESNGMDKTRAGFDVQWDTPLPGVELRAEWMTGEEEGADVDGWYTYAIWDFTERQTLTVRVDEYDDEIEAITTFVGAYSYEVTSNTKLMVALEHPDEGGDVGTLRFQYKF